MQNAFRKKSSLGYKRSHSIALYRYMFNFCSTLLKGEISIKSLWNWNLWHRRNTTYFCILFYKLFILIYTKTWRISPFFVLIRNNKKNKHLRWFVSQSSSFFGPFNCRYFFRRLTNVAGAVDCQEWPIAAGTRCSGIYHDWAWRSEWHRGLSCPCGSSGRRERKLHSSTCRPCSGQKPFLQFTTTISNYIFYFYLNKINKLSTICFIFENLT